MRPVINQLKPKSVIESVIEPAQYNEKLQYLLKKIETQNRYSNRITITNYLNLSKYQQIQKELDYIKQQRKIEQLNEVQLKNLNSDLNKQIKLLKEQLETTSVALIDARKQIRMLSQRLKIMEQSNLSLEAKVLNEKKKSMEEFTDFKLEIVSNLLQSEIKQFLTQVEWVDHILIDHCRESLINQDFNGFFMKLYQKMQKKQLQHRKRSVQCPRLTRSTSKHKGQTSANKSTSRQRKQAVLRDDYGDDKLKQRIKQIQNKMNLHRRVKTLSTIKPELP